MKKQIITFTTLLVCAIILILISSTSARAGQYAVTTCDHAYGMAFPWGLTNESDWYWGANGFPNGVSGCNGSYVNLQTYQRGTGRSLFWSTRNLDGDLTFANVFFNYYASTGGTSGTGAIQIRNFWCRDDGDTSGYGFCNTDTNQIAHISTTGGTPLSITHPCSVTANASCKRYMFTVNNLDGGTHASNGHYFFFNIRSVINDPSNPVIISPEEVAPNDDLSGTAVSLSSDDSPIFNSGTVSLLGGASDGGSDEFGSSGVSKIVFSIDGKVYKTQNNSCANPVNTYNGLPVYHYFQPCGIGGEVFNTGVDFDTTTIKDGKHVLKTTAYDLSGNISTREDIFYTDNTAPSVPSGLRAQRAYNNYNNFALYWKNKTETEESTTTQSGISQINFDVTPISSKIADPAPIEIPVGGTVNNVNALGDSLTDITVPDRGKYRMSISLIDVAGNESETKSIITYYNPKLKNCTPAQKKRKQLRSKKKSGLRLKSKRKYVWTASSNGVKVFSVKKGGKIIRKKVSYRLNGKKVKSSNGVLYLRTQGKRSGVYKLTAKANYKGKRKIYKVKFRLPACVL